MQAAKKAPKGADGFFKEGGAKEELSATRKADQKTVDTVVCPLSPKPPPAMSWARVDMCCSIYVPRADLTALVTHSLASCSCTRAMSGL
jgi:hypothetical protein